MNFIMSVDIGKMVLKIKHYTCDDIKMIDILWVRSQFDILNNFIPVNMIDTVKIIYSLLLFYVKYKHCNHIFK